MLLLFRARLCGAVVDMHDVVRMRPRHAHPGRRFRREHASDVNECDKNLYRRSEGPAQAPAQKPAQKPQAQVPEAPDMARIIEVERAKFKTEVLREVDREDEELLNKFNEAKSAYEKSEQDLNHRKQQKPQIINEMLSSPLAEETIRGKAAEVKEEVDKLKNAALADAAQRLEVLRAANAAKVKADTSMQNYIEFLNAYAPNKKRRGSQE